MTDIQNLTDNQINKAIQSFPHSMIQLDKKGKRKLIDYVNDYAFCLRVVEERGFSCYKADRWAVSADIYGEHIRHKDESLTRAILLTYLKLKGWTNE